MKKLALALSLVLALAAPAVAHRRHETPRCPFPNLSPRSGPVKVERFIRCMSKSFGVSPADAVSVARCESGSRPTASNGGKYLGVFQHDVDEWPRRARKHGFRGHSAFDPRANVTVTIIIVSQIGWRLWDCQP